jgi:8-oxo-dGTP pyrophosphatase MutT (NUDIX family)
MQRRFQTGYEDGNYSVVAGHLEGNETVAVAASREALEEVGIEISPDDVRVVGVMHRRSTDERVDWFVLCERWAGEVRNTEPTKCDELRWVDPDRLPRNTIPYVRRAIDNFRAGRWFDSFGWD